MSPVSEQLLSEALSLPVSERLDLAAALLEASEPPCPDIQGEAWVAEIKRRSSEVDVGSAVLTPWTEVKRRVKERLGGP